MRSRSNTYPLRPLSVQSSIEEAVNTTTHGVGLLLSIGGVSVLLVFANVYGNAWHIVACSIYGATLVMLYAASTSYHAAGSAGFIRGKQRLRNIEQASIFLFIAGTYTPFTLVVLNGAWGWSLFCVVWGLSVTGTVLSKFYIHCPPAILNLIYLSLGWLCLVAIVPLRDNLPLGGFLWLLSGGVAYTVGTIFLSRDRIPFNHGIWHFLVLAGSICHYFAILFYVIPF